MLGTGGVDRLPKPRDSKYGAYYFPWIQVYDPLGNPWLSTAAALTSGAETMRTVRGSARK